MNTRRQAFFLIPLLIGCIALTGCSSSVVKNLQLVVAGSEAVVAALETTGTIPAPIAVLIDLYMGQVSEFTAEVSTILASSASTAVKDAQIAAAAAKIAKLDLPPGVPLLVANSVQAVATALATFLTDVHVTASRMAEVQMATSFAEQAKPKKLKMSDSDKKKLEDLHARAEKLKARFPKK